MPFKKMRKSYAWRCRNTKCKTWTALREGTFFSQSKLAIAQILKLIYLWSHEMARVKNIRQECDINSAHTLTDWSSCLLSAYSDSFRYQPGNPRLAFGISTSPGIAFSHFFKWQECSHVRLYRGNTDA